MDYIDEILEEHFAGNLELEELDQAELNLVLERLNEMAEVKILDGFDEKFYTGTIHIASTSIH